MSLSKFIKAQEAVFHNQKKSKAVLKAQEQAIAFLQHERKMHLLVTLVVVELLVAFFALFLWLKHIGLFVVLLILAILALFYLAHYAKLENTLARWYRAYLDKRKTR